jgi:hypothetical protein
MCDTNSAMAAFLAAQASFLVALGFVGSAILTSSNPFTSGGSPALLGIALGALAIAFSSIGFAISRTTGCAIQPCVGAGSAVMRSLVGLEIALGAMGFATAATIAPSAIPFAGAVLAAILAGTLGASTGLFQVAYLDLLALETCRAAPRTPADDAAGWLAPIVIGVGVLIMLLIGVPLTTG